MNWWPHHEKFHVHVNCLVSKSLDNVQLQKLPVSWRTMRFCAWTLYSALIFSIVVTVGVAGHIMCLGLEWSNYIHHHLFLMPYDNSCVILFPNHSWAFDQGSEGVYINHITQHFITVSSSNKRLCTSRQQSLWSVSLIADCQAVCGQNNVWLIWLLSNKVLCQCVTKKLRLLLLCIWANTHNMNRNHMWSTVCKEQNI